MRLLSAGPAGKDKMISNIFLETKPGTKGRRLARRLDDQAIARAIFKSADKEHQAKFTSRWRTSFRRPTENNE
jgi:hypothetical protein